jgi:hypothetical protein
VPTPAPAARSTAPAPAASASSSAPAAAAPAAAASAPATARTSSTDAEEEAIVQIVVVGMRALPGRETNFTAEDGTVWVQTDSQRLAGFPATPFAAELKPGAMGSYFLVPKERGRAVRVRQAAPR